MFKVLNPEQLNIIFAAVDEAKNTESDTLEESGLLDNAQGIAKEALSDALRQVVEMLDGIGNPEQHEKWSEGANFDTDYKVIEHCLPNCPACVYDRAIKTIRRSLQEGEG